MPAIRVECVPVTGDLAVNCYIVENIATGECLVVDPGAQGEKILSRIGSRKPVAVLLTHAHWDHIGAVDEVCQAFQAPLYVHELDAPKLTDNAQNVAGMFGFAPKPVETAPVLLKGGETIELAGIAIQVLHTPGHSQGSVCYLLPDGQGILTGDTLFAHGYGRTDFPGGDFMQLRKSIVTLFKLTPKMTTYPGHDETGEIGRDPVGGQ